MPVEEFAGIGLVLPGASSCQDLGSHGMTRSFPGSCLGVSLRFIGRAVLERPARRRTLLNDQRVDVCSIMWWVFLYSSSTPFKPES